MSYASIKPSHLFKNYTFLFWCYDNVDKMKSLLLVSALIVAVSADVSELLSGQKYQKKPSVTVLPAEHHGNYIRILSLDQDVSHDGSFHYSYDTENGIHSDAQGSLKQLGPEDLAQVSQGSYSYKSPEGETVQLQFIADENGYQPQGSHIPTPPPIPEAIRKALEFIASQPKRV